MVWALAAMLGAAGEPTALPRERIEWCNIWIPEADREVGTRVLLVGDSIAVGYKDAVAAELGEQAAVALLATSRCVADRVFFRELEPLLDEYRWDVIHINNGLHGWGYSEEQYADGLRKLWAMLRAKQPACRLVWAATTPVRVAGNVAELDPRNARAVTRNTIARDLAGEAGAAIDDLYTLVIAHPEWHADDGVHFQDAGRKALGAQVAAAVRGARGGGE